MPGAHGGQNMCVRHKKHTHYFVFFFPFFLSYFHKFRLEGKENGGRWEREIKGVSGGQGRIFFRFLPVYNNSIVIYNHALQHGFLFCPEFWSVVVLLMSITWPPPPGRSEPPAPPPPPSGSCFWDTMR